MEERYPDGWCGVGELYYTDSGEERERKKIGQQRERGCVHEKVGNPWDILDLNKYELL